MSALHTLSSFRWLKQALILPLVVDGPVLFFSYNPLVVYKPYTVVV